MGWRRAVRAVVLLAAVGAGVGAGPQAQAQTAAAQENIVQLSATAQQEAVQDWLTVVLLVRQQAADAATVQNQLKAVLDRALAHARPRQAPGVEVSTGAFSVHPRQGRDGQILGWQGSAELVLQGRDVARLAALAGDVPGMAVSHLHFSLSREAAQRLEAEVRQQAIARFQATALQVAQNFGFKGYGLREVTVGEAGLPGVVRSPRMLMAAEVGAALSAAPVPAEPGKSLVQVTVSGSVQLR